jgi:hypothetical protein
LKIPWEAKKKKTKKTFKDGKRKIELKRRENS